MSKSLELGEEKEVRLDSGTVRYRERGSGPTIVFVHGLLVNGDLWRKVVPLLAGEFRCITPDWPLGSHDVPLDDGVKLTTRKAAGIVRRFLDALNLDDVTLVGNDTGGALCQIAVTRRPERIGRLVLTSCDYRDNFPPAMFAYFKPLARVPGLMKLALAPMRFSAPRHLPMTIGWLVKRRIDRVAEDSYLFPAMAGGGVERDVKKVIRGLHKRYTIEAADRLGEFDKPALIAWSREDRLFKPEHAERLAEDLPNARLEWIDDARTFSMEDNPERLAELIAGFVGEPARTAA